MSQHLPEPAKMCIVAHLNAFSYFDFVQYDQKVTYELTPIHESHIKQMAIGKNERTDGELIQAATSGDNAAFAMLVRRYEDVVYRFSFKVCRDRDAAEEAFQDTFVNVFRKLDQFDGKSKLSTWLYRIVTNNCLMKKRRRKIEDILESYDEPRGGRDEHPHIGRWEETPEDMLHQKELQEILDKAIKKLPMDYRVVFVLRDVEGRSTEEAAEILNISQEATKSRLRRARAFLRDELNPYFAAETEVRDEV